MSSHPISSSQPISQQDLKMKDADILLIPNFLSPKQSQHYLQQLKQTAEWKQESIRIFGKWVMQPRLVCWYGDEGMAYTYSGREMKANGWLDSLLELKQMIEQQIGGSFNSVLLNLYRDGSDSMGWHSDDEKELGEEPVIASLSLGATRRFRFKHRYDKQAPKISIDLTDASLLIMKGLTQKYWHHALPKTKRKIGERINLTFRRVGQQ